MATRLIYTRVYRLEIISAFPETVEQRETKHRLYRLLITGVYTIRVWTKAIPGTHCRLLVDMHGSRLYEIEQFILPIQHHRLA